MLNPHLDEVPRSCWRFLEALLDPVSPPTDIQPVRLHVGDPEHPIPAFMLEQIVEHQSGFGAYAPITGTPDLRKAIQGWLDRRYSLPEGMLDTFAQVMPVAGLREAMFLIGVVVIPESKNGQKPLVAIPNPFYHSYVGAAVVLGAEPLLLPAARENNFLPDFGSLPPETLARLAAVYLCTPSNPQGTVASLDYLRELIGLARQHDFVLLVDECYADIYVNAPPPGVLEACADMGGDTSQVLSFHSTSKRSNVPGLRSGFVVGDPDLLAQFKTVRDYGGVAIPRPVQAASAALWNDDEHARVSRELYHPKFTAAARIFGNRFGFYQPQGGMFLWLNVNNCVEATRRLWAEAAIRVLPGKFMSAEDENGCFPGEGYIRVALVPDLETTTDALERMSEVLDDMA